MSVTSTLVSVFVGAALSHGVAYFQNRRSVKVKKTAIFQEIDDLTDWADRHIRTLKFNLQLIELEQPFNSLPIDIKPFLFEEHFHEVCIHLTKRQRIAIVDFYSVWKHFNQSVSSYMSLCDNPDIREKVNLYEKLRALYFVAWELKAKGPWIHQIEKINVEAMKGAQSKIDQAAEAELQQALEEAHDLGPQKLKEKYYSG